jgi:hypothetical protein
MSGSPVTAAVKACVEQVRTRAVGGETVTLPWFEELQANVARQAATARTAGERIQLPLVKASH